MSYAEFQTFAQKAVSLDVPERIELITFLVKSLPQAEVKPTDKTAVEKINAVLEKISATEQLQYCDAGLESVREALKNDSW